MAAIKCPNCGLIRPRTQKACDCVGLDDAPKCPQCGSIHLSPVQKGSPGRNSQPLTLLLTAGLFGWGQWNTHRLEIFCLKCGASWVPK